MNILISGASTGIGRACAIDLARKGHRVWAGVRSPKSFDDLAKIKIANLEPVFLDVTEDASVEKALRELQKKDGVLHALVNNAGIAVGGPIEALPMEEWRRQFETNFFGVIRLTKACLPLIRETKGRIVNVSSISGRVASPFLSPYSTSKFALESFSDSLRREMRPLGVKVSVIEPGAINTPIWAKSRGENEINDKDLDPSLALVYGNQLVKFKERIDGVARDAEPVALVINALDHALTSDKPKTRYPVGRGIALSSRLAGILPDPLMDKLLRSKT